MFQNIKAYQIVYFNNKEKESIIKVLKHNGALKIEEDSIGRIFGYFNGFTVVLEKNIELTSKIPAIQVIIENPCPDGIIEALKSLKVDKIMIVDETKKEIKIIEVKSKNPLKSVQTLNPPLKSIIFPKLPIL
jgi:hypothetical protein